MASLGEGILLGGPGGIETSAVCLGALPFGTLVDEEASMAILDRFAEAGGTFVDTANNYCCWIDGRTGDESELLLGRWLARSGARDRMVIATKVGARPDPRRGPRWPENAEGLSGAAVRAGIEGSLRRLGTDHVDLYYAHVEDPAVPAAESAGAFAELVDRGVTRMLGVSNHDTARLARLRQAAADSGHVGHRVVQQRHTYARPRPGADFGVQRHVDAELLEYVRRSPDVTLLAYSTLLSGAYTRTDKPIPEQYDHPGTARRLSVLREVASEVGATPHQVVLAWLLRGDPPVVPVLGVSSVAQLDECLGALDVVLDDGQRARLDAPD